MLRTSRQKKMARWIVLLVSGIVVISTGAVLYTVNRVKRRMAEWIMTHPEETAVVAYTFDENGQMINDATAILHNPDALMPVASVMKLTVLAAYAEMVAAGELDPQELVPVADWERYYLPVSDGGAHLAALRSLGLRADELGFAIDQTAILTLDDLATFMMYYSGNAATDYLLERIGPERVTAVARHHLPHHTQIGYTLGHALAVFNHEEPFSEMRLQQALANVGHGDNSDMDRLVDLYLHDEQWRLTEIDFLTGLRTLDTTEADMWSYQTSAAQLLPRGTAREYAGMMARVATGTFVTPEVSAIMQQKLQTVPSDWPLRAVYYQRFGAKDGTTAGLLTVASYAVPKRGRLRGEQRVVVLFTTGLPPAQFATQVQFQGHYLLSIDLVEGRGHFIELAELSISE